ncbi:MAG: mitochondrial fission ELM1 family protein [Maricaulaceae bacterium]|nr:mitochondrial fission ELM1 family protein [Maricaulaceae bacterium]
MTDAPIIWAVADARRGVETQALGLAGAVARATGGAVHRVLAREDGFAALPDSEAPDVWIGCARPALALARRHRSAFPRALFVYVQDPRKDYALFDLVFAPAHDRVKAANAVSMLGAPGRVTAELLAAERAKFADRLAALPGPRAAVLVGGKAKRFPYDAGTQAYLENRIAGLLDHGLSLMVTVSRRTPKALRERLRARLGDHPRVWLHDGAGDNPYFAFLAAADWIFVTEDSTNMLTEAATAGAPVYWLPVRGRPGKFARLRAALAGHGALRPWLGRLERWDYEPLRETGRAAAIIARRFAERRLERPGAAA